uniref:Uncharacterized protein n=1 Tax=Candidatus Methanogaster sp. ANME-2c ERB4 TaxID=2759911 RepID=A0A7G9Y520_9EURY|nr:hypothetical protein OICIIDJB_00009 [Methanosarcinales archaeon ANME-2c ERB4]QNO43104.1 hypothetical protein MLBHKIFI_00009 [Methanosarcinales archaeon ANME-2c ERB4]
MQKLFLKSERSPAITIFGIFSIRYTLSDFFQFSFALFEIFKKNGYLDSFRSINRNLLIALDSTRYFSGSLVIRVAHICTVSHYKTKPLSGDSIGGKSEEVKSRSEKLWIGRRKSFLYKVTM